MNRLLQRFFHMLKRSLTKFLEPADDPRHTFANAYQRQRELLAKVQRALLDISTTKQRLETKTAEVRAKLPKLQERARGSLVEGREDLARLALQRRQVAMVEVQVLEEQVQEVENEEQRLSLTEQRLSTQLEAFFARQELIAARYSAAEAQVRIHEAFSGVSHELSELGRALEKAEEKSVRMQARATAIDRLIEDGILNAPVAVDSMDKQFLELDIANDVEVQLAALKQQLD
jgi:phage shock protein A